MKLKDLSSLGDIYANIATNNEPVKKIIEHKTDILLTDATQYLPENKQVKPGSPLGGGPGTKGNIEPLAKKTGPEGLKGNNFVKVDKQQDPGSDAKAMKAEEEHEADEEAVEGEKEADENEHKKEGAKVTTPKEKVQETVNENNKYNYKPKFTMSKLKFDQLYEDAIKRIPFTEDADPEMAGEADMPDMGADDVPPADDAMADAEDMGTETDEVTITLDRATAQKLHDVLMAQLGGDDDMGGEEDMGGEDEFPLAGGDAGDDTIAEEVEAEDLGHAGVGSGAKSEMLKDGHKVKTVSDLKVVKGTAEKGNIKNEPTPKEEKGNNASLQGKSNKVGSGTVATTGRKAFE